MISQEIEAVREANDSFYRAFESLSLAAMEGVWLASDSIHCTHPGWPRRSGFAPVMQSWRAIFEGAFEMRFEVSDVDVSVEGDVAWVVCTETLTTHAYDGISRASVEATNVFRRVDGEWRLVHHHGSPRMSETVCDDPSSLLQ